MVEGALTGDGSRVGVGLGVSSSTPVNQRPPISPDDIAICHVHIVGSWLIQFLRNLSVFALISDVYLVTWTERR